MDSPKSESIFELIPLVMSEVGAIEKNRKNTQGSGYMFRGIDDVYEALQPVLHKHGVFFVPTVLESTREDRTSKAGGGLIYTVLKIKYTFFAKDGSHFETVVVGEAMDSGDKSANKAMSAGLKVACLQIFCIPTQETDKDTENHSPEVKPKGAPAAKPKDGPSPRVPAPKAATPATPAAPQDPNKPSVIQIAKLFASAKANNWTNEGVGTAMKAAYGVTKTADLTMQQFGELLGVVETMSFEGAMTLLRGGPI